MEQGVEPVYQSRRFLIRPIPFDPHPHGGVANTSEVRTEIRNARGVANTSEVRTEIRNTRGVANTSEVRTEYKGGGEYVRTVWYVGAQRRAGVWLGTRAANHAR